MTCSLASSVILNLAYSNGVLTLTFAKYRKRYESVPIEVAYKLVYSKTPLATFNQLIKNKFKNEKVK